MVVRLTIIFRRLLNAWQSAGTVLNKLNARQLDLGISQEGLNSDSQHGKRYSIPLRHGNRLAANRISRVYIMLPLPLLKANRKQANRSAI